MLDREAFLRTICENVDDTAPRLVYADYLDERGFHDRAEFIRIQCENPDGECFTLGEQPEPDPEHCIPDDWQFSLNGEPVVLGRKPITRKLSKMAVAFREWAGIQSSTAARITYCRGFIEEITMSANDFFFLSPLIFSEYPIRRIQVNIDPILTARGQVQLPGHLPGSIQRSVNQVLAVLASEGRLSEALAVEALSDACVRYGRCLAGLNLPMPMPIPMVPFPLPGSIRMLER